MQLGLMLCKDHCGIRRRSFELGYHVHVKLSEEMCQSQLCGKLRCVLPQRLSAPW